MRLNDKLYDVLKWVALIALNAIGVFYNTLSEIWGLPYGEAVLKTCSALALFIGALIGVSTIAYNKEKEQ
jgi:hypothetical protein